MKDKYSWPFWSRDTASKGQPANDMNLKYENTILVAIQAIKRERITRSLNIMGLFADNHRTFGDYARRLTGNTFPEINNVIVIEKEARVFQKILSQETLLKNRHKQGPLWPVCTELENLLFVPGSRGRPPSEILQIQKIQHQFIGSIDFFNLDFTYYWKNTKKFSYLPELLTLFASPTSVVNINAVQRYPRSVPHQASEQDIQDISSSLMEDIKKRTESKVKNSSLRYYKTRQQNNNVETTMASLTFVLQRSLSSKARIGSINE